MCEVDVKPREALYVEKLQCLQVINNLKNKVQCSKESKDNERVTIKTPSLKTLINWNISKTLQSNPGIDLKAALQEAQDRLKEAHDVKALVSPDARNLCCALLAWQQLGHRDPDSLFNFVERALKEETSQHKQNEEVICESIRCGSDNAVCSVMSSQILYGSKKSSHSLCEWGSPTKVDFSTSIGLVVKLPPEPQMLMHLSGPIKVGRSKCCSGGKSGCTTDSKSKLDNICCLDKACLERLTSMEMETQELRKRAAQFAKRETQRTELLERAEMAWRDLDAGYQRRLKVAKDKEDEYQKQMARVLSERNRYKEACMPFVAVLKEKTAMAEKEEATLKELEKDVCAKACARVQLAENSARIDAELMEHHCKASRLDRNLALKEEQELRKHRALASAAEAAQVLTHEAEYAQREELQALRGQVSQAAQDLLEEDARTALLEKRIEDYMQEKDEMIKDLEACQTKCDGRMGGLTKDLKSKKDQIMEFKKKVMECLCKEPVDRAVEVKRTPSLAAMCMCSPSGMIEGKCSCTSIRTRLLSSLLRDLFGGLKAEMETISSQMPCHLLKCLEDKHNWDRTTEVKQNVRAYFSRLLLGELDIAIATVIEKCHAQWVSECCADLKKPQITRDSKHSIRWQEHELEMKVQKMASELAEKMFKEKAKELALQAQEELTRVGRPPCECDIDTAAQHESAIYRCQVPTYPDGHLKRIKNGPLTIASSGVHRKCYPITQLTQIRSSKKDTTDVRMMLNKYNPTNKTRKRDSNNLRPEPVWQNNSIACKPASSKRISNVTPRKFKSVPNKGGPQNVVINVPNRELNGPPQYAVNMCLCDTKNDMIPNKCHKICDVESIYSHKYKHCNTRLRQPSPIRSECPNSNSFQESDKTTPSLSTEKYACLHKIPSNTSVDRLLSVLTKWKDNLVELRDCNIKEALNSDPLFKVTHASIEHVIQELCGDTDKAECLHSFTNFEKSAVVQNTVNVSQENKKNIYEEDRLSTTIMSSQLQVNQSKLLIAVHLNDSVCKCETNVEGVIPNTNNNDNPLHNILSPKSVYSKSVSAKIDIKHASVENCFLFKNEIKGEPTKTHVNNNATMNYKEKLALLNNIEPSAIDSTNAEKCIECLGATLANAICKRSLSKNTKQENETNKKLYFHQQQRDRYNKYYDEQSNSNNCQNSASKHIGDVARLSLMKSNNNCENFIQFLGVTLDNPAAKIASKQNLKKRKSQNNSKPHHEDHMLEDKRKKHKSDKKLFKTNSNRNSPKTKCAIRQITALNVLHLHNECIHPQNNIDILSEDKSVNVRKISGDNLSGEHCVCCPIPNADNSNDLECNAFQLLEEHLRCKLDELKNSACRSSCLQDTDAKSILGDTLLKVKKLILENATVTCKCVEHNHSSGRSWNRAYSLLQEYLKSKIEHVECLCSDEYSRDENLVPRILSQINCLIENDLQRLKEVCKCATLDTISKRGSHITHESQCATVEVNKNDNMNNMNISHTIAENVMLSSQTVVMSELFNYTEGTSLPHNKSAQVLFRQSVDTKSCDALKTYSKYSEVQTIDSMKTELVLDNNSESIPDKYESTKKAEVESNACPDVQSNIFPKENIPFKKQGLTVLPIVMSPGDKDFEIDSKKGIVHDSVVDDKARVNFANDKVDEPFLAYIGCTINCCCDRDLGCVCTKSTLPSNTDWLKTNDVIWKKFTQKQSVIENVSYVLNKIANILPKHVNSGENVTEDVQATNDNEINMEPDRRSNYVRNTNSDRYKQTVYLVNDCHKEDLLHVSKRKVCESEVSAREEKNIYLKKSEQRIDLFHGTANTLTEFSSLNLVSMPSKTQQHSVLKRNAHEMANPASMYLVNSDITLEADDVSKRSQSAPKNCDCAMVPMCHVKMLVESIGNKLVKAECTCDSIKSVCPIHF